MTCVTIVFVLYMAIISKIVTLNQYQPEEQSMKSFIAKDGSDVLACMLVLLKFSKMAGVLVAFCSIIIGIIGMGVMKEREEILFASMAEFIHMGLLLFLVFFYFKFKI